MPKLLVITYKKCYFKKNTNHERETVNLGTYKNNKKKQAKLLKKKCVEK